MADAHPLIDDGARRVLGGARLLVLDVDGVLSDGRVVYVGEEELQSFHAHDGAALRWLQAEGVKQAWITGRGCRATERRANELGIDAYIQVSSADKRGALSELASQLSITRDETVAMGDDLADLALRAGSAFFAAPANARSEVRAVADLVTHAKGGEGCVRELAEHILRAKGRWQAILDAAGQ